MVTHTLETVVDTYLIANSYQLLHLIYSLTKVRKSQETNSWKVKTGLQLYRQFQTGQQTKSIMWHTFPQMTVPQIHVSMAATARIWWTTPSAPALMASLAGGVRPDRFCVTRPHATRACAWRAARPIPTTVSAQREPIMVRTLWLQWWQSFFYHARGWFVKFWLQ